MKLTIAIAFIFAIPSVACHNSAPMRKKEIHPDISQAEFSYQSAAENWLANSKYFNLSNLSNETNSIELRIWPKGAFKYDRDVFVFQKRESWKGYHYYSYTMPILNSDGIKVKFKDRLKLGDSVFLVREVTPICGWHLFEDTLHYFDVENMQTQDSIPGLIGHTVRDGDGYAIEFAKPNSYRLIHYSNADAYSDSSNKRFNAFIQFMKRQLGTNYDWPKRVRRHAFPILGS
jgi:hypothetical protein